MSKEEKLLDYYYLFIWGCVDAQLIGPFSTENERDNDMDKKKKKERNSEHIYVVFEITKNAKIEI